MLHTIKAKQTLGLLVTILTTLFIVIITINRYEDMINSYEKLTDNISNVEDILYTTDKITDDIIKIYSEYDLETDKGIRNEIIQLQNSMSLLKDEVASDQSLYVLRRLGNSIEQFKLDTVEVISHMTDENVMLASQYRDEVTVSNGSINRIGKDLVTSELANMQLIRNQLDSEVKDWKIRITLLCFLLIITFSIILWKLNSSILVNVNKLLTLFRELGKGNLEFESPIIDTKDEFKVLMDEAENMKKSLRDLTLERELSRSALVTAIGSLAEMRDKDTGLHIQSIQQYLQIICNELLRNKSYEEILTNEYVENLIQVAPLHDIGKVGIPDRILMKPGKLTYDEFELMKKHVEYGTAVIHQAYSIYNPGDTSYFDLAEQVISEHHEKWNGSGYPKGIKGDNISLAGRLIAIVDVYDALTTDRIYKKSYTHDKAISIITEGRGTHFDPHLVDIFLDVNELFRKELDGKQIIQGLI